MGLGWGLKTLYVSPSLHEIWCLYSLSSKEFNLIKSLKFNTFGILKRL